MKISTVYVPASKLGVAEKVRVARVRGEWWDADGAEYNAIAGHFTTYPEKPLTPQLLARVRIALAR